MKDMLFFIPLVVTGVLVGIVSTVLRFKNPDLNDTQLFLRFWKTWTIMVVVILAAFVVSLIMIF
jgi:hypothetical protein